MSLIFLLLTGCNGCRPQIPTDDSQQDDTADTQDTQDSGETADTTETSEPLPPRCDLMEVEPNNTLAEIEAIPMEQWVCGWFNTSDSPLGDIDFYSITPTEPGWLLVSLESANRGSSADGQFTLLDDDNSVTQYDGYLTTDPLVVVPIRDPHPYTIALGETSYANGDDYNYGLLTSLVKQPVEWDWVEAEANDSAASAQDFPMDSTVFGTIGRTGDFDWYHVVTPADADRIIFTVEATSYGSPLDTTVILYEADATTRIRTDYTGEVDYDRDPWWEQKQDGANEWYLQVRNAFDGGSDFHWYTLNIRAEYDPDTGG